MSKRTPFDKYLAQLENAATVLNLDPRILERLKIPALLIRGKVKVEMDDGTFKEFNVFRCQHNHARGPTRGGTRFDPAVCESEVKFLAAMMTMKNTIDQILNGGGKGGICVDKIPLSLSEGERLCRGYTRTIHPWIGPRRDGPAPDVNTGGQEMAWFLDEQERLAGEHCFGAFTGKPLVLGGSLGRGDATALGAVYATEAMIKQLGLKGGLSISIQGFGNAGDFYAKLMSEEKHGGHKIVSVSDRSGVIYKADGFDYTDLHNFCYKNGKKVRKVTEYPYKDALTSEEAELLSLTADIFAPAAFEDKIDAAMARAIKSKFIVELANGPCTEEADAILAERGVEIIPDIYASGGGVRVSAAEKIQGLENQKWTAERVAEWLRTRMFQAFEDLVNVRKEYQLKSFREAAMVFAVREVAEAMTWRGGFDYPHGEVIDVEPVVVYKDLTKRNNLRYVSELSNKVRKFIYDFDARKAREIFE
ncbi:MAG: Glu/Leu/Phe/Val dehydrogenase [Candidatus Parcubacteria bacterium]|nr:Glu/Leu/Phe/Val dehydrogenase [Candidatus Parcubacteria bacterium]